MKRTAFLTACQIDNHEVHIYRGRLERSLGVFYWKDIELKKSMRAGWFLVEKIRVLHSDFVSFVDQLAQMLVILNFYPGEVRNVDFPLRVFKDVEVVFFVCLFWKEVLNILIVNLQIAEIELEVVLEETVQEIISAEVGQSLFV
jgi:hypothetical protein